MIKSSSVDVDTLLSFIKANHVVPVWINMQLPFGMSHMDRLLCFLYFVDPVLRSAWAISNFILGRNMNQCMQVVEHLTGEPSHLKRQLPGSQNQSAARASEHKLSSATAASPGQHAALSQVNDVTPVAILPWPTKDDTQNRQETAPAAGVAYGQSPTAEPAPPKKRGRPSRADKAKKDLRPMLPPHLAPRLSPGSGHRLILPAAERAGENQARAAAMVAYSNNTPEPLDSFRGRKRRRMLGAVQRPQNNSASDKIQASSSVPGSAA